MVKKNLIYYTCTGEEYSQYAIMSISTLLKNGNFKGDIFVFCTEEDFKLFDFDVKENIFIFPVLNNDCPYIKRVQCADFIININSQARLYNQIMYIDADVLIRKDINPMFCAKNCLMYDTETKQFDFIEKGDIKYSWFYTDQEYEKNKYKEIVNAGIFCCDATLFPLLIKKWNELLNSTKIRRFGIDQASLNKIIYTGMIPSKQFQKDFIFFLWETSYWLEKTDIRDKAILYHYLLDTKYQMSQNFKNF